MAPTSYTLYYFPYSICSIQARYTVAVRGEPKDVTSTATITEYVVDIMGKDHLTEEYLCDVNPKGQVPVLMSPSLDKPITETLDITYHLAKMYPNLIPDAHRADMERLLRELHQINYFSLSMKPDVGGPRMQKTKSEIQQTLNGDVSERYKKALRYKLEV